MKRLAAGALLAAAVAWGGSGFAANYFVDAVNGDDANDGLAETANGASGPKKTLAGVMAVATASGDVVTALPGVYDAGTMSADGDASLNRVVLPKGVTLQSRDGAEKTFIVGQEATDPIWNGCGTDSARGAYLSMGSKLVGFTVTGGRARMTSTSTSSNDSSTGGGVCAQYKSTDVAVTSETIGQIVDCVISNNYAFTGAGGLCGCYRRCRVVENVCYYIASGIQGGTARTWVFDSLVANNKGAYQLLSFTEVRNSTIAHGDANGTMIWCQSGSAAVGQVYNSVLIGNSVSWGQATNAKLACHRSVFALTKDTSAAANIADVRFCPEQDCTLLTSADSLLLDAEFRPSKTSPLVDAGSNAWYTAGSATDLAGSPRVLNGRIDLGCYEYDWRGDFSTALNVAGIAKVTQADASVVLDEVRGVRLDAASEGSTEMTVACSRLESAATTRYAFKASVEGDGELAVYQDAATEPLRRVTSADGEVVVTATSADDASLRLVFTPGEGSAGSATVQGFSNAVRVDAVAEHGGVTFSGDVTAAGEIVVGQGTTCAFSVARAFDSAEWLCTGVRTNGVFVSFDDAGETLAFTVSGDDAGGSLSVEAVYAETPIQTWYVDPVGGDDANYGVHPKNAHKTLKGAMSNAKLAWGHTVVALPGVYDAEVMSVDGDEALNRVVVPQGVTLQSRDGAEKTFIVGQKATEPLWNGCGTDSARCVYLNVGSKLVGFTVTGGRARMTSATISDSNDSSNGGGVFVQRLGSSVTVTSETIGQITDCVISNNYAYTAAGGRYGFYRRCRVVENTCRSFASGILGLSWLWVHDSLVAGNKGAYQLLSFTEVRNSTIAGVGDSTVVWCQKAAAVGQIYNSVLIGKVVSWNGMIAAHRSVFALTGDSSAAANIADTAVCPEQDCTLLTSADSLLLDAEYRPSKASPLVDAGSNAWYTAGSATDVAGSPRVLNGSIDLGCHEYDWRGDYASDLGGILKVPSASEGVFETDEKAVRVPDGGTLVVSPGSESSARRGRRFAFAVSGGTLSVAVNGAVVATVTADGTWDYKDGDVGDEIAFSFAATADGGCADLLKTTSTSGLMLIIR